jgi:6-phosphogluconolactonase (cycloisomerase 2 family)
MCGKKRRRLGVVYAMTNAAEINEVIAFRRSSSGKLSRINAYATGGSGTGEAVVDPLVSQGSLILSHDGRFLFAVNAGSDSISSFHVSAYGSLTLVDVDPSGGTRPNSLAVFGKRLYVTNAGDAANNIASNVTGFYVKKDGRLKAIPGATSALSTANAQPACIVFSPHGHKLVVSELNNNRLSVFFVNSDGTLAGPVINNSNGGGPFGSDFLSKGYLLVSEAGPNALSSYTAAANGTLNVISPSVLNGQLATCWVSSDPHEHFAFTSNTGSRTITTYRINNNGTLSVAEIAYSTWKGLGAPIDSGVSRNGCFFYVLNGNQGSISAFRIGKDGRLIRIQVIKDTGLPELGAQGLAVR